MTDQPPLSEAAVRDMLARVERSNAQCLALGLGEPPPIALDTIALARECLRLRALLGEAAGAHAELRLIGAQMANLCCNLSQPSWTFEGRHRGVMRELYQQWDAGNAKAALVAARVRAHLGGQG